MPGNNTVSLNSVLLEAIQKACNKACEAAVARAMAPYHQELLDLRQDVKNLKEEKNALQYDLDQLRNQYENKAKKTIANETVTAIRVTDTDVHRRKWNIIIQGVPGEKDENESTEKKIRELGQTDLRIESANSMPFRTCHRLQQAKDAGIIVRFSNLTDRNMWLNHAKNLRNTSKKISISPDIPPTLKPLKAELLNTRITLPSAEKSKLLYHKTWPYLTLKIQERTHKTKFAIPSLLQSLVIKSPGASNLKTNTVKSVLMATAAAPAGVQGVGILSLVFMIFQLSPRAPGSAEPYQVDAGTTFCSKQVP
ncbi:hypothetical protein CAPTEDRAFT_194032 [Capitella teleta]|uniref:Uncharacterized protein n=1 Tax=Capitella teleta TaxID=283909 RepID=R7UW62_CAPTE|nr:hypothetical protein CAPTEDRAFT_194032 [Capitella teleta]|eukprot:ELU10564.1 hypothetical protein CAPTEDRAFT_194032 [Capitella teleta]